MLQARSPSPLQPVERPLVQQAVPLQPMEYHSGAGLHAAARGGAPAGAGGPAVTEAVACARPLPEQILGQPCSPWRGAHARAGDGGGAAARGGPRLEQCAPEGWSLWDGAILEQFSRSCCLWEAHAGSVWEGRHLWEGPHVGAGDKSDREAAAETKCYRLTAATIPAFSYATRGEEGEEDGWGKGVVVVVVVSFCFFVSHFSASPAAREPSPCALLTSHEGFSLEFSLPSPAEEGTRQQLGGHLAASLGQATTAIHGDEEAAPWAWKPRGCL